MKPVVGFAGMTHLGLVSAAAVADRGFEVMCFDPDGSLIERLGRQDWPVHEPGLGELIGRNGTRQRFTRASRDLGACEVVYVAPDVPTDDHAHSRGRGGDESRRRHGGALAGASGLHPRARRAAARAPLLSG
jgi:UDPglucose 6-dehydrogenase